MRPLLAKKTGFDYPLRESTRRPPGVARKGEGVVKRVSKERDRPGGDRVTEAVEELLREIRASEVPASILELADILQQRLDEAEEKKL